MGKKIIMKQTVAYMIEQATLGIEEFQYRLALLNRDLDSEQETHFTFKTGVPIQLNLEF